MPVVFSLIALVFVLLMAEKRILHQSVKSINLRIHVNGTRGKSSITTYIAAALRSSGVKTMGKITGEIPTLILGDGTRQTIKRRGPARIQEQFRIIRKTATMNYDSLVLECMSIDPALQETESRHFSPGIYVLSNVRDDHREKLGSTRQEQVQAMCRAIPRGCTVVCGDSENLETIRAEVERKKSELVLPRDWTPPPDLTLPPGIFPGNIALAAEVAFLLGTNRDQAITDILEEIGNQEEICTRGQENGNRGQENASGFLNAFSVNDPDSTTLFLNKWRKGPGKPGKMLLIFNTRADRPERTDTFTQWIEEHRKLFVAVYITGDHRARANARLKKLKPELVITPLKSGQIKGLKQVLHDLYGTELPVLGIGNLGGTGYGILKEFES